MRGLIPIVKKLTPTESVEVLPHVGKKSAEPLMKAVKTAIANATQKGTSPEDLRFKSIEISEGPKLKRYRAGSRGSAKPYVRRMSHIRIVLETAEKPKTEIVKKERSQRVKPAGQAKPASA